MYPKHTVLGTADPFHLAQSSRPHPDFVYSTSTVVKIELHMLVSKVQMLSL